jgi:LacI family transcriptional regulator
MAGKTSRVTLVDVARLASVDKAIVSRIVNNDPTLHVRPDTRRRVEESIIKLGYVTNSAARHLRTSESRTYGLVIPDFSNPVYAEIIVGAEDEAARSGYVLMVTSEHLRDGDASGYAQLLGQDRIDGLLIAGGSRESTNTLQLGTSGVPWLYVNRRDPRSHRHVALDDERGAEIAVNHLVELGHRTIGHIAGPPNVDTAQRRYEGYSRALANAGLVESPRLVVAGDYSSQGGFDATMQLLGANNTPTAIFVANVTSAVGVLHALHGQGLRVPEDISVIALHDHFLAQHLVPSLSTVKMPLRELGAKAVELLRTTQPDEDVEVEVSDPITLIQRESTAPPKSS